MKNLAEDTLNCIKNFSRFYPMQNSIGNISLNTVQDYILWQKGKGISAIAINSNIRGLRTLLYYCMKLNYMNKFQVELIKAEKRVKQIYSDAELQILLKTPNINHCSFSEYRNWVIVNYALATGNRVNTIINLKIEDVD